MPLKLKGDWWQPSSRIGVSRMETFMWTTTHAWKYLPPNQGIWVKEYSMQPEHRNKKERIEAVRRRISHCTCHLTVKAQYGHIHLLCVDFTTNHTTSYSLASPIAPGIPCTLRFQDSLTPIQHPWSQAQAHFCGHWYPACPRTRSAVNAQILEGFTDPSCRLVPTDPPQHSLFLNAEGSRRSKLQSSLAEL